MTGIMRKMKIKTKRGAWTVMMHWREGVSFVCNGQFYWPSNPAVPLAVRKKARCFIVDPDRFGQKLFY